MHFRWMTIQLKVHDRDSPVKICQRVILNIIGVEKETKGKAKILTQLEECLTISSSKISFPRFSFFWRKHRRATDDYKANMSNFVRALFCTMLGQF